MGSPPFRSREMNLRIAKRGPDLIIGDLKLFGAFGGVLKLLRTFGAF